MKQAFAVLILFSMVLHCASRLGFVSYLYSQRHVIAYHVGLIAEVPIEICGSEYFANPGALIFQEDIQQDQQVPSQFLQAKEINLFVQQSTNYHPGETCRDLHNKTLHLLVFYTSPDLPVFHPPCEG